MHLVTRAKCWKIGKFTGEEGVDQGGVPRAWFELAAASFVRSNFFEDAEAVSNSK